ncbi:MAG: hypothetical protein AAF799_01725 [Myxococcota bacterium]
MASTGSSIDEKNTWKRCSTCRGPIAFASTFYVCSVSTCNRKRTTYRFCSVACWEEHLPMMRHREAWAVEETSPKHAQSPAQAQAPARKPAQRPTAEVSAMSASPRAKERDPSAPRRRIRVGSAPKPAVDDPKSDEVLVVVSRFKSHVRERYGVNTSDGVFGVLSDHLRDVCRQAVDNARADGRKTVMDRDFAFLRRR